MRGIESPQPIDLFPSLKRKQNDKSEITYFQVEVTMLYGTEDILKC